MDTFQPVGFRHSTATEAVVPGGGATDEEHGDCRLYFGILAWCFGYWQHRDILQALERVQGLQNPRLFGDLF